MSASLKIAVLGCGYVGAQFARQVSGDGLQLVLDDAQWQRLAAGTDSEGRPMQLTVSYAYGDFTNVRALRSDNLTDRDYEYVWFDNFFWAAGDEQPMFSPAPGRSAYLSVNMKL